MQTAKDKTVNEIIYELEDAKKRLNSMWDTLLVLRNAERYRNLKDYIDRWSGEEVFVSDCKLAEQCCEEANVCWRLMDMANDIQCLIHSQISALRKKVDE